MLDITTLAAWGEFIGGIAVVVSLLYLASQIRQNSKIARVTAAQINLGQSSADARTLIEHAEVSRIYYAGLEDLDVLSDSDRRRFDALMLNLFSSSALRHQLWREGVMSREAWQAAERRIRWQATRSGVRQWWSVWRFAFADSFSDLIDGLIREGEAAE